MMKAISIPSSPHRFSTINARLQALLLCTITFIFSSSLIFVNGISIVGDECANENDSECFWDQFRQNDQQQQQQGEEEGVDQQPQKQQGGEQQNKDPNPITFKTKKVVTAEDVRLKDIQRFVDDAVSEAPDAFMVSHEINANNNNNDDDEDDDENCADFYKECKYWTKTGQCRDNAQFMFAQCRRSCGACIPGIDSGENQEVKGHEAPETGEMLFRSMQYLRGKIINQPQYASVKDQCKNKYALCTFWSQIGECTGNPQFMNDHCPLACMSCESIQS